MKNCMIRYAQKEDYADIEKIMKQVQGLHVEWRPDIYKKCDTVLPEEIFYEAVKQETFLVAEVDEQIVGLLAYMHRHIETCNQVTRDVLFIDSMAVDENFRGQGIGHQLFDYIKTIAKEKNFDRIELQVNARNVRAKKMYESYGFTEKSINMEIPVE